MTATHLMITVELVGGAHADELWPRPGRVLVAARSTTFHEFADAIDGAFARWDRAQLHLFTLDDGTLLSPRAWWLKAGEQFAYVFDRGRTGDL